MELGNVTRSFAKRIVGGNVETLAKLEAGRLPKAALLKKADRGMIALVFVEDEGFKIVKITSSKAVIQSKGVIRVTDGSERFDILPSDGYAVEEEAKPTTAKPATRKPAAVDEDQEDDGFEPGQSVYIVSDELKPIKGEVVKTLRSGKIVVETAEETAKLDAEEVYLTRAKAKAACAEIAAEMEQEDGQEEDQNEDEQGDQEDEESVGSGLTADDFEVGQIVFSARSAGDRVHKGEVQKVNRKTVAVLWDTKNEFREPFSGVYLKKSLALKA